MKNDWFKNSSGRERIWSVAGVVALCAGLARAGQPARVNAAPPDDRTALTASLTANRPMPGRPASLQANPGVSTDLPNFQGRRDPFKLPPPPSSRRSGMELLRPTNLPPGPRGLIVGDLKLEGIVSENSGREMIAVVTNNTDRGYFLEENQQLYDGQVTRITPGAVYFTERVLDGKGRVSVRQVVKTLTPRAGEGQ